MESASFVVCSGMQNENSWGNLKFEYNVWLMFLEGFCGIERQSMSENSLKFSITNEFLLKSSVEYRMILDSKVEILMSIMLVLGSIL